MKVFITGQNGFIAKHLSKHFDTVAYSDPAVPILKSLSDFGPNYIFHLGAELHDNSKMFSTNLGLTVDILEYCRENKETVKKCIIFGSSSEYGRKNGQIKETDSLDPVTIYEGTKGAASLLAQSWSKTYDLPVTLIRPFTVYGPDEKPNKLTQIIKDRYETGKPLYLGPGVHDYIYVEDFVGAIIKIVNFRESQPFNIVNVGSGVQTSNEDFIRATQRVTGQTLSVVLTDSKQIYDSESWVCDTTILSNKYHFTSSFSLEDGLRRTFHLEIDESNY